MTKVTIAPHQKKALAFFVATFTCVVIMFPTHKVSATVIYVTTTNASWPVPVDWNSSSNTIECLGGGGGGTRAGGGAGGGYARAVNVTLTPGGTANATVGAAGSGASSGTGGTGGTTSFGSACSATGGTGGIDGTSTGAGGTGGTGVTGSTLRSGGNGGNYGPAQVGVWYWAGGGGGGAAGFSGNGSAGAAGNGAGSGGAGGAGNGGAAGGSAGSPGSPGTNGGTGTSGTNFGSPYGSGGGGGGGGGGTWGSGNAGHGGFPGTYGAGGGGGGQGIADGVGRSGAQGIIVITYTPNTAPTVTTNSASIVIPTEAKFFGAITATGGANATQSGFAYGTVSTLNTVIATTTLGAQSGTASFSSSVTGLSPNTTYYYRAYATNVVGTSYGSILSTASGNTTPARRMRLFEGFKIRIISGKMIIRQQ